MKKITLVIATAIVLISCGGNTPSIEELIATGDEKAIATKKTELLQQKEELEASIAAIQKFQNENNKDAIKALVSTTTVKDTLFTHYIELQGSVDTKENIMITSEMPGLLTRVYVKEGQRVSKGQLLAKLDDAGLAQQVEQMKVQVQLARTTFERQQRLWNENIGSEIQFLQAKTNYEAQNEALKAMQRQLGKMNIIAPFGGTIDNVVTEQGNVVSPGLPLFRLVSLKDMYLNVEVPETYITSIQKGTEVIIDLPVIGETLKSKVRQTSNYINPANRSFNIEVPVKSTSGNIKPNLTAKLKINDYTSTNAKLVPLSVINENQQGAQYVMIAVKEDGQLIAKRRSITTGKTSGDLIEVLAGLNNGDQVITAGARTVKEGELIDIKN
jgi:RND family efflux transporter MFP subunit